MATCSILYWQDIPSLVEARDGRQVHKVQLSARFQELIDIAAMRRGLAEGDAYLAGWRRVAQPERDGDPLSAANALAGEIEARFDEIRAGVVAGLGA